MQIAGQASSHKRGNPNWRPGISGNPRGAESRAARQARIVARVAEWAAEWGGVEKLSAIERDLLRRAAELELIRPRRHEDAVRVANTISKLLAQTGFNRHRSKSKALQSPWE